MRVRLIAALLVVATSVGGGVASATGADHVRGGGTRGDVTFEFLAVITPSGNATGRVSLSLLPSSEAKISCGSVSNKTAVIGGTDAIGRPFTIAMRDDPDGVIFGSKAFPCDTTGFGDPGSLPITSGYIAVVDR